VAAGPVVTEHDPFAPAFGRTTAATTVLAMDERGIRSSVVRLPPSVHGHGDGGFVPTLIEIARRRGVSGYIAEGDNRWPAVHRLDAAHLFRLALEQAPAGSILHAIGDEGVRTRTIADVIGRRLELPVVSVPAEEAAAHFGWMGTFFGFGARASSSVTRELLGWIPGQPGLVEDLDAGHYFETPASATALSAV
jgi:nucleoside-diphosphate-sugar epimerase